MRQSEEALPASRSRAALRERDSRPTAVRVLRPGNKLTASC
jgi:hypothetical protein